MPSLLSFAISSATRAVSPLMRYSSRSKLLDTKISMEGESVLCKGLRRS